MSDTIHLAITRRVRREHARAFEAALAEFASRSLAGSGSRGLHLLYPPPGADTCEYGILRSFASTTDRDAFYDSALFKEWLARIEPMVDGAPTYRELSGLEGWFRAPHAALPARWKMAVATFLGVFPVAVLLNLILGPAIQSWPFVLSNAAFNLCVVALLTWVVMPVITRLLHGWLYPQSKKEREPHEFQKHS